MVAVEVGGYNNKWTKLISYGDPYTLAEIFAEPFFRAIPQRVTSH